MMKTLGVNLDKTYQIYIDHGLLDTDLLKDSCLSLDRRLAIITDSNLINSKGKDLQYKLQQQGLNVDLFAFLAGEANKSRATKQMLEDKLLAKKFGRDSCLIALGGGVVSDLVGFVAATYCRGIPVIYIPTTLLAMVDASIGGKTGINTPYGKNLIGTFTQPHAVLIDTQVLRTLAKKELSNGMVEMIKHSIIGDPALFEILQKNVATIKQNDPNFLINMIYANCVIKKNIVEQDEQENGIRQLLNFGHTIGHAIEVIENYNISHGVAVAIGMLVESYLSVQCGYLHEDNLITIQELLEAYELPLKTAAFKDQQVFQKALILDKKSMKNIAHFVLLDKIGKPYKEHNKYTMPVDPLYLSRAFNWAAERFGKGSL